MTRNSKIEWTDHTFNPWVGCTKISPGCDHCYAETWAKRSGMVEWGGDRRRTSTSNWNQVWKWDKAARAAGVRQRVFCASLADVFDNEVPEAWRVDLFDMIARTTNLDWLLLTKRIGNAARMIKEMQDRAPIWSRFPWPQIWIGATIVDQEEADRDIPKLLATPAAVRFLSCEPLLGPITLKNWVDLIPHPVLPGHILPRIHWVIAGGESGHGARPMHPDWARSLRDQCVAGGVPFLFKQWGAWLPSDQPGADQWCGNDDDSCFHEWSDDLYSVHLRKHDAGRDLDGRTWDEFPLAPT